MSAALSLGVSLRKRDRNPVGGLDGCHMISLAELLEENAGETLDDIGFGHNELVLRCTSISCKDWFFYVSLSVLCTQSEGEVIGSQACGNGVTKSFVHSKLAPHHCKLRYEDASGLYYLQDLNSEEGTWLQFPPHVNSSPLTPGAELVLGPHKFSLQEGELMDLWREIVLVKYGLAPIIEELQLTSALASLNRLVLEDLPISPSDLWTLRQAVSEVQSLPSNLRFLQFLSPNASFRVGLKDLKVGSDPSCDIVLSDLQPEHALLSFHSLRHSIRRLSEEALVELRVNSEVAIQPGCSLRISDLTFDVCSYNIGVISHRGARSTQEDTVKCIHNLGISDHLSMSYFALFDGHGGPACAQYLSSNLHTHLRDTFFETSLLHSSFTKSLSLALAEAFYACDEEYRRKEPVLSHSVGSTALMCLLLGDLLITANLGDSRAVLCRAGLAINLSVDHKAVICKQDNPTESERIKRLGGVISFRRIGGKVAFSRSFGDFEFKPEAGALVSNEPEVRHVYLDPVQDEFLLMGCDGLWDVFSSQEAVDFVRTRLKQMPVTEQDPQRVARELVNSAIYERRSGDNVTVILVALTCAV